MDVTIQRPAWLSSELYPFAQHYFETPAGMLHYIDEGHGRPLVFVHGNPSWSFEFRKVIQQLSGEFRCIAVDHIGFGLSSKAITPEESHPRAHAGRLAALLEHLALDDITLVMCDWGTAMGLDFAIRHPERVSGLVVSNSWAWPVNSDPHFVMFSWAMSSALGQGFIRYFNGFVNTVMPMAVGMKTALTPEVMAHYRGPMGTSDDRRASAALPQYILSARPWLEEVWGQRSAFADKPAVVIWGGADIAFRQKEFSVWQHSLRNATGHFYKQAGHMVAEEIPEIVTGRIRELMARSRVAEVIAG